MWRLISVSPVDTISFWVTLAGYCKCESLRSEVRSGGSKRGCEGKRNRLSVKILSFSSSSLQNVCQIVALSTPSRICNPWTILDPPLISVKKMLNVLGNKVFRSNHITKNPKYRNFALSSTLHYYFRNLPDFQTM